MSESGRELVPRRGLAVITAAVVVVVLSGTAFVGIPGPVAPGHMGSSSESTWASHGDTVERNSASDSYPASSSIWVSVGQYPIALAVDDRNGNVYVANWYSDNVSVINGTTNTVIASVPVGSAPEGVTYVAVTGDIYVANAVSDNISIINATSNSVVGSIPDPVGSAPAGEAYDNANGYLYVADQASGNVAVVNVTTQAVVGWIPAGSDPNSIAFDPANGYLYVPGGNGSSNTTVINGANNSQVATILTGPGTGAAYDSANRDVYVAERTVNVAVVNGTTNQIVASVFVGADPSGVAYDRVTGQLFVSNSGSWNASVINGTTNTLVGYDPVGLDAFDVAFNPVNRFVYTANFATNNVSVIGPIPALESVVVSPSSPRVPTNGSQSFGAALTCLRGICTAGATYTWTLSNTLATLHATNSSVVVVTAGLAVGSVTLFANVTLGSRTVNASAQITIIPGLTSLTVSPTEARLVTGASETFRVSPVCSAGACPSDVSYVWTLSNNLLGNLNFTLGPSVEFQAGSTGVLRVYVNATVLNETVEASAPVTIVAPAAAPGYFSSTVIESVGVVVAIVAVAALAVFLVRRRRRRARSIPSHPSDTGYGL